MKLLLHICCAPCSVSCIKQLRAEGIEPTGFWYNPNIHPFTEYRSRKNCLIDYAKSIDLDLVVEDEYGLRPFVQAVAEMKLTLSRHGYGLEGDEPLKLTLVTRNYGYTGYEFAGLLRARGIEVEFSDPDFAVMMLAPALGEAALARLTDVLLEIPRRTPILTQMPTPRLQKAVYPVRQAMLMPRERIPTRDAEGRILASLCVACPPAVPIAVCGERLDRHAVEMFQYYGITHCDVLKD